MKVVILAGGAGTRLSEETTLKPKPMIEIGGKPILWHIMDIYGAHGFREFVVALGYKGEMIKEYFLHYFNLQSDLSISLKTGQVVAARNCYKDWTIHLIDTGLNSMTGGRVYGLRDRLRGETFMLTYGDGVSDVHIENLLAFHRSHGKLATITAVRPTPRFGGLHFDGDRVTEFTEKPQTGEGWINGGFFVFEPQVLDYLDGESTILEREPLENLARNGQLMAYKHHGFWQCMDTLRDKQILERLWESGDPPWIAKGEDI